MLPSLMVFPFSSFGQEKKADKQSLAKDAAQLLKPAEQNWVSGAVPVTRDGKKVETRLTLIFSSANELPKGNPSGKIKLLAIDFDAGKGVHADGKFELFEKEGKRHIKLIMPKQKEVILAYSLTPTGIRFRGGVLHWVIYDVDFGKGVSFELTKGKGKKPSTQKE
jgi:hypothetical protein